MFEQHDLLTKNAKFDCIDQLSHISNADDKILIKNIINSV